MRQPPTEMAKLFLEVIAAPVFDEEAKAAFAAKKNLRLVRSCRSATGLGVEEDLRRLLCRMTTSWPLTSRSESRDEARTDAGRKAGAAVRVEGLQAREVERDSSMRAMARRLAWGGADEPRGFLQRSAR